MNEMKGQGNERSLDEGGEAIKALIDKTVDNGRAILETKAATGKLETEIRGLREAIGQLPDQRGDIKVIFQRTVTMEEKLMALNRNFGDVATVYLEDAGRESGRAAASKALIAEMQEHKKAMQENKQELKAELDEHKALFEKPQKRSIQHTHFLGRPLLALGTTCLFVSVLVFFLIKAETRVDQYKENDIKWRSISLGRDTTVLRAVYQTIEAYRMDPEGIQRDVIAEEDRRQELFAKSLIRQKTEEEIEELKQKEKPLPGSR